MHLVPWTRRTVGCRTPQNDLSRLFEDFFRGSSLFDSPWHDERSFAPSMDIRETESDFIVEAELPGIDPKAVDVSLEGGVLRLRGERKREHDDTTKNVHRVERFFGQFERAVALPEGANADDVEATYTNGVLSIRIGKREEVKPRSIPINSN